MKIDVVVTYYRQEQFWGLVSAGLSYNHESINKVIVVNDEVSGLHLTPPQNVDMIVLEQPHQGYGVARAVNLGVDHVGTDAFAVIQGDIMLAPESLAINLACLDNPLLLGGPVKDFVVGNQTSYPVNQDFRVDAPDLPGYWKYHRSSYFLTNTDNFRKVGGYDPAYDEYGFEDYDFAVRWFHTFGDDTWALGNGVAFHCIPETGNKTKASSRSLERFKTCLATFNPTYTISNHRNEDGVDLFDIRHKDG